jgi:hypothetical protein
MNLLEILDRPIAFQRSFVRLTGSINAALFLSQSMYWANRTGEDGWFYKTQKDWEEETGLTRREQETARKILKEKGILEEKLCGVPATLNFRINRDKLRTCLAESATPACTKEPNTYGGKRQTISNSETTTETTTERGRFTPPTIEAIRDYCRTIGMHVEQAEAFLDHHKARGWILSNGKKMQDYRAALRTWKRNRPKFERNGYHKPSVEALPEIGEDYVAQ